MNQKTLDRLVTEVKILTEVSHEHVVHFKQYISEYALPYNLGINIFNTACNVINNIMFRWK